MEADFWHDKWASNQIGFHEDAPHPMLVEFWDSLALAPGARVFVPLCGKSNDMHWLRERGHEVVGVELSEIAVRAFFDAHGLTAVREEAGPLDAWRAPGYTLWCGDFFALDAALLGDVEAVYDRAALIALPQPMRAAYAAHLAVLAAAATRMLLVTVTYDESALQPPPFVVPDAEVESLYGADWRCARLTTAPADVKGHPGTETVWRLERTATHAG